MSWKYLSVFSWEKLFYIFLYHFFNLSHVYFLDILQNPNPAQTNMHWDMFSLFYLSYMHLGMIWSHILYDMYISNIHPIKKFRVLEFNWEYFEILCAPLFRMGRSLALQQRICKARHSGYGKWNLFRWLKVHPAFITHGCAFWAPKVTLMSYSGNLVVQ